jgi:hypothetical protein
MSSYSASLTGVFFVALAGVAVATGTGLMLKSSQDSLKSTLAEAEDASLAAGLLRSKTSKQKQEKSAQLNFLSKWEPHFKKEDAVAIRNHIAEIGRAAKDIRDTRQAIEFGNDLKPEVESIGGVDTPVTRLDITMDGFEEHCYNAIGEVPVRFPSARIDEFSISATPGYADQVRVFVRLTVPQFAQTNSK